MEKKKANSTNKQVKIFRSVFDDAPPNPLLMLLVVPVALFCILINYLYERSIAATCKRSNS